MSAPENLSVLLVEDNEDDLFFFRRLFVKAGLPAPTAVVTDGAQAITYLEQAIKPPGNSASVALPRLVFLDLKLPLRGGFEVLSWIRAQPLLSDLVVIVLSSSAETRDVVQAFQLGAQGYLVKYPEPQVFVRVMQEVAALPVGVDLKKLTLPGLPRP